MKKNITLLFSLLIFLNVFAGGHDSTLIDKQFSVYKNWLSTLTSEEMCTNLPYPYYPYGKECESTIGSNEYYALFNIADSILYNYTGGALFVNTPGCPGLPNPQYPWKQVGSECYTTIGNKDIYAVWYVLHLIDSVIHAGPPAGGLTWGDTLTYLATKYQVDTLSDSLYALFRRTNITGPAYHVTMYKPGGGLYPTTIIDDTATNTQKIYRENNYLAVDWYNAQLWYPYGGTGVSCKSIDWNLHYLYANCPVNYITEDYCNAVLFPQNPARGNLSWHSGQAAVYYGDILCLGTADTTFLSRLDTFNYVATYSKLAIFEDTETITLNPGTSTLVFPGIPIPQYEVGDLLTDLTPPGATGTVMQVYISNDTTYVIANIITGSWASGDLITGSPSGASEHTVAVDNSYGDIPFFIPQKCLISNIYFYNISSIPTTADDIELWSGINRTGLNYGVNLIPTPVYFSYYNSGDCMYNFHFLSNFNQYPSYFTLYNYVSNGGIVNEGTNYITWGTVEGSNVQFKIKILYTPAN